jgi:hypothetical protein
MNQAQWKTTISWVLGFLALSIFIPTIGTASMPSLLTNSSTGKRAPIATLLKAPMSFEANQGQIDPSVNFIARGSGYTLFLTPTESVMVVQQREATAPSDSHDPLASMEPAPIKQSVVRMKLEGANPAPAVSGMEQLPGIVNYFIGNDPTKWRTKVPTYAKVNYEEVYPGIDVAYYGNQGRLEYDFIVAPGADPSQIKLAFEGALDIKVNDSGDLLLTTAIGEVRLQKPVVYQLQEDGRKTLVAGNYATVSSDARKVGIHLAAYDTSKAVVIDPVLLYSTYLGGSANEAGIEFGPQGIAVDSLGNAYIAGATASTDFPGVTTGSAQPIYGGGSFDAYVAKLSSTGASILWTTYLGGISYDRAAGIALDPSGNAYVTGFTNSTTSTSATFPTTAGAFRTFGPPSEAFVSKISSDGATLLYSTLLGGNGDRDIAWSIAVDATGSAYVAGETRLGGASFPTTAGAFQTTPGGTSVYLESSDAFVTKLNPSGTGLVYSTYIGGSNNDGALGIAVDSSGNAYVTGNSRSTNFPGVSAGSISTTLGGFQDAFIVRLNASGSALDYASYLGGTGDEFGRAIAVDATGNAYATGQTTSANFPVTAGSFQTTIGNPTLPGQYDAYVTKISSTGSLVYSTFLGGNNYDGGWAIMVDSSGNAHVVGRGRSSNFPGIVPLTGSPIPSPVTWAFYSKVNPTGTGLRFSVYLGGTTARAGTSGDTEPLGLALDAQSNAYITGFTRSANFPLLSAAQSTPGGTIDDFVMKIGDRPLADAGPDQSVSMGALVTLNGTGSTGGSLTYAWTKVAGPTVALGNPNTAQPTFTAPNVPAAGATVTFQLTVCEGTSNNCSDPDTVNVHITNVNQLPVAQAGPDQTVQEGSPVLLDGSASYDPDIETLTYTWLQLHGSTVTLDNPHSATPRFTAPSVGASGGQVDFELVVHDARGLVHSDFISVHITNVNQPPTAHAGPDQTKNENTLVTLDGSGSHDPDLDGLSYHWLQTGGPGVALTGATTANPTFTAPNVAAGGAFLTFQLVVHDGHVSSVADTVQVAVVNVNDPPVCSLAQASPNLLWPPNHTMTQVSIVGLTDPQNQTLTITYPTVKQDEPINGLGDGDTSPDAAVSGNDILLRAERSGTGNGRVYVVQFMATNADGAQCSGTVKVTVPHNKKDPAIEGPQLYNSFLP